jgi:hypothetical protein
MISGAHSIGFNSPKSELKNKVILFHPIKFILGKRLEERLKYLKLLFQK